MDPNFICESEVYKILENNGVTVPIYGTIKNDNDIDGLPFEDGDEIVLKGIANDLWHKSDEGALHFSKFNKDEVSRINNLIQKNLAGKYQYLETLICRKIPFKNSSSLPCEGFVSFQIDDACGVIISFGLGGIHTESWAASLKTGILMWPVSMMTPKQALAEVKEHLIGKIWLGTLRQGEALTSEKILKEFIEGLWRVASFVESNNIKLLEMNPMVLDDQGRPMALDGVGLHAEKFEKRLPGEINANAILNPKKVAIAGVSEKATSFGKKILDNLIASSIPNDDLLVIKPGANEFAGIKCCNDVSGLIDNPVDVLILALPAPITVETLLALCKQGGGAEAVYLVAGGIGDGADKKGFGKQVKLILSDRRSRDEWTPSLIGPNSLGIVLSPLNLSTLFISPRRLPINYYSEGNIGLVSQSGAFFITRISTDTELPIKYGHCIGNQIDIKVSDFIDIYSSDSKIQVIGAYVEGFDRGDALAFATNAKKVIAAGKPVVLYKGGRSSEGMKAAAGHTGAMAGNWDLQKNLFEKAGVIVTESFAEYSSILKWLSAFPKFKSANKVAVISNAGFETVGSADHLGEDKGRQNLLLRMDSKIETQLNEMIEECNLTGLVSPANPFDITPMASDKAYLEATRVYYNSDADAVVTCIVPLSDMLHVFKEDKVEALADGYREIASGDKPLAIVVDSGALYDNYRAAFEKVGLPVYRSVELAFMAIKG